MSVEVFLALKTPSTRKSVIVWSRITNKSTINTMVDAGRNVRADESLTLRTVILAFVKITLLGHRSHSPKTISIAPKIAVVSASMWPLAMNSIACRCENAVGRILQR